MASSFLAPVSLYVFPNRGRANLEIGFDRVHLAKGGASRYLDGESWIFHVYPMSLVERPMQVQVARWGNSLGLRIPKDIALRAGLREGARVEVEAEGDRIIVSPARPRYVLADLLKGMTPQAMREAFDWGPDRGREIVE
jgi:antitoxin MazE